MPAFTHLCEKINISLFNDTITIYPKIKSGFKCDSHDFAIFKCFIEDEVADFLPRSAELGYKTQVFRKDRVHNDYHQDDFDRDKIHLHFRFAEVLDETRIKQILRVLVKFEVISVEEEKSFIDAYRQIQTNEMPAIQSIAKMSDHSNNTFTESGLVPFFKPQLSTVIGQQVVNQTIHAPQ